MLRRPAHRIGPAPDLIAENGKWKVQCETRPAGKDAKGKDVAARKACAMVQISRDAKRPQIALSLIMRQQKQGNKTATMMQIMAPIGVFLPTGIALEIDGAAVGRVPFVRCLPQTRSAPGLCTATAEAQAATVAKMKAGNSANFIIYEAPGAGHQDADFAGRFHSLIQGSARQQLRPGPGNWIGLVASSLIMSFASGSTPAP